MKLYFSLFALFFVLTSNAKEIESIAINPPDSTSSLIDRTASLFLIEEGKEAFYQGRMKEAMIRFREAYVRDQYSSKAVYWIGETHYNLDNFGYALKYARISEALREEVDGKLLFLMGSAYHRQNQLDSAALFYVKAGALFSNTLKKSYQIDDLLAQVAFADSVQKLDRLFTKTLLEDPISSGYDDYNLVYSQDGKEMFFVSRRPDTKGGNLNPDDQRYFEDSYYSKWSDSLGGWTKPTNEIERLNSEGFDAVNYINADGTEIYMTVNTAVVDVSNATNSSDICLSRKTKQDRWSSPRPIDNKTINTSYFEGAPTFTEDGNTMYFVSDRDGEDSRSDIYVVYRNGRSWGEAQKLPMTVNTTDNETTPFVSPDGRYLFFSSEGYTGMGGYDVYVTENKGNEWTTPVNLGADFNTVNDDLFFKYYEKLKKANVSTYRIQGNKSSIDIFEIDIDEWEIPN
ncbi:TolB-like translocation protein [Brumimicrobium aurantiacum]|uniref:Uncharacterized protein n=1 Tax=Brumimicrobium aurantiacum TaxID=1737063 RepID=A0A3E1EUA1_9FLAO|nr:PD40 domain-containing protein [Brumimicrobium aurantiacum]RFC53110.1 hypothetical protein DXU93_14750 [Brumimicrobium aurantiacum]